MTETTHTLLDDAANLLQAHGEESLANDIRFSARKFIPNVPVSPRSETAFAPEVIQLLRDIQSNMAVGEPEWSSIESRIEPVLRTALKGAAQGQATSSVEVVPARETVAGSPASLPSAASALSEADKLLRDGAPIGFRTMTIQERIKEALQRIRDGRAYMRIPADQTDPDVVLADCLTLLTKAPLSTSSAPGAVRAALLSQDLYQVLLDVQNGIDSPGLKSMANGAIVKLDKARAELYAADAEAPSSSASALTTEIVMLLRDIQSNAASGEPDWSDIEQRIQALLRELHKAPLPAASATDCGCAVEKGAYICEGKPNCNRDRTLARMVRLFAEGSDWKRNAGETLVEWLDRTLHPKGPRSAISALTQLERYGLAVLEAHRRDIGDLDGGFLQDTAEKLGLLYYVEVTEPCGEYCRCAEYDDFPQQCLRLKPEFEPKMAEHRKASAEADRGTPG